MSNLVLQCRESKDFQPHPEGIHPAVCVDVIDLGLVESEFQGQRRMVEKVKVVFESEQTLADGTRCTVTKDFTASLHSKAKLTDFLGKWRGRPLLLNEFISLEKLIGACCTLVISHQMSKAGKTYASIDAVSKPTRKVVASGTYDPAAARQRIADWKAKAAKPNAERGVRSAELSGAHRSNAFVPAVPQAIAPAPVKSAAPQGAREDDNIPFDPEVGF